MPRFVVLHHELPRGPRPTHWDFMLEHDGVLRTWALAAEPAPGVVISADALADHRLAYLDYEGPVSQDRGTVQRWDAGEFDFELDSPDTITVCLRGARCNGRATLTRESDALERWQFRWTPDADEPAK